MLNNPCSFRNLPTGSPIILLVVQKPTSKVLGDTFSSITTKSNVATSMEGRIFRFTDQMIKERTPLDKTSYEYWISDVLGCISITKLYPPSVSNLH